MGEIHKDEMLPNAGGNMVVKWWNELVNKFPFVMPDIFVVMPNHLHGIIIIHEIVGADLRVGPSETGAHAVGADLCVGPSETGTNDIPLSQIMQWFKTMTTNEYIRGVKQYHWPPFSGKLWQRNYYEHIIRNEEDYERIYNYIESNPSNWAEDEENR